MRPQSDLAAKAVKWREDFPVLRQSMHGRPLIYLDTAATAQKPQAVIDAMHAFYCHSYGTVHRAIYELSAVATESYQQAREKAQGFLGALKQEEIIFTRGTTESINLVARSFGQAFIHAEDEIVISEIEHHSNIVPWQLLCQRQGARLRVVPVNERGELCMETYERTLNEKTKLVAIAHMSNALGSIHPIKEIARQAHQAGAKILVDGAQGAPHLPIDVQDLDVDFYAFSGHKLYGPTGIGILYGKEALLNAMPPYQGGGDMIETVSFEKTTYHALPLKFEAGTPPIAEAIGLASAIDYLQGIGKEKIAAWEGELLRYATRQLQEIPGLRLLGTARHKGAIVTFVVEGTHPLDIGSLLDLRGVAIRTGNHCAQPAMKRFGVSAAARASFGLYNTLEDVDLFVGYLRDVVRILR